MKEIWRTVVTEDGIYENYKVSNYGRIKSLNYRHTGKERILSPVENNRGYLQVKLYKNGESKIYKVHRLVAYAFLPNVMNYEAVDHRDTNKKNNTTLNIIWCTQKQNNNNELTKKKMSKAQKGKILSKETKKNISKSMEGNKNRNKKVLCLETGEIFACVRESSRELNIDNSSIAKVCRGKFKRAGKLTFRFLDQVLFYN